MHEGAYILSDNPVTDQEYEPGVYYETDSFTYGDGIYVIIQDEASPEKFYTLIKSMQDLEVGDEFIWRDGDVGGRLLDDKYTSTHMAGNYKDLSIPMCPMTPAVGKLSAQTEKDQMTECLQMSRKGFTYLYLVSETAADFAQRTANEEAGYEEGTVFRQSVYAGQQYQERCHSVQ